MCDYNETNLYKYIPIFFFSFFSMEGKQNPRICISVDLASATQSFLTLGGRGGGGWACSFLSSPLLFLLLLRTATVLILKLLFLV